MSRIALYFGVVLLILFIATMATPQSGPVGVTQRIFVIPMMAWWMTLGWHMWKLGEWKSQNDRSKPTLSVIVHRTSLTPAA